MDLSQLLECDDKVPSNSQQDRLPLLVLTSSVTNFTSFGVARQVPWDGEKMDLSQLLECDDKVPSNSVQEMFLVLGAVVSAASLITTSFASCVDR